MKKKTSILHRDIGEHEHEVTIFDSYELYAVCRKCGMHDWGFDFIGEPTMADFKNKYPKHKVVNIIEEMRRDAKR